MVRWYDSIVYLKERGVTNLIEIGAGKVLTGLAKRIDKEMNTFSIQTAKDIDEYLKLKQPV
jgi:[acyl-carrier-protein] S-malonyltransferase